jgi:radical SAM superfamily enzyme YgiQ (UPF0313 family)
MATKRSKQKIVIIGLYLPGIYPSGDDSVVSDLLAPAFLKSTADADPEISAQYKIKILNLPTSTDPSEIARQICDLNPSVVAYSVYMWNYSLMEKSSALIKKTRPEIRIILGGPQVTYNSVDVLKSNPQIDLIVCGSGESRFKLLLKNNLNPDSLSIIPLITYRDAYGKIIHTEGTVHEDLSLIPSPYQTKTINLNDGRRHTVFIETFRGCPFKCGYCIWGESKGLNKFPLEQILKDIEIIYNNPNVSTVCFTDSCIFYMRERAKIITDKIASCSRKIPTVATLDIRILDEEMIECLDKIQLIRNQFHFGLQTINPLALKLLKRKSNKNDFEKKIELLRKIKPSAEISFDLIYGVPGDNYTGFRESIDFALSLNPSKLYLSPLLVLPGTLFWDKKNEFEFNCGDKPPYMVRSNKYYSAEDMEKTFQFVLWVLAIFYFPAIRDIICNIPKQYPKFRRIDLFDRFIEIMQDKMQVNAPECNIEFDFTIESNNLVRRQFMNTIAKSQNCMHVYEAVLELLKSCSIENHSEDILIGLDYYKTVYKGIYEQDNVSAAFQKYGKEKIAYIKNQWVSAECLQSKELPQQAGCNEDYKSKSG